MNTKDYWQLFMETGLPEAYLMYRQQQKSEASHVYDDPGYRPEGHGLQ